MTDDVELPAAAKPGKTGRPRTRTAETTKQQHNAARARYQARLRAEGRVQLQLFVRPDSWADLKKLVKLLGVAGQAEAVERLVAEELARRGVPASAAVVDAAPLNKTSLD